MYTFVPIYHTYYSGGPRIFWKERGGPFFVDVEKWARGSSSPQVLKCRIKLWNFLQSDQVTDTYILSWAEIMGERVPTLWVHQWNNTIWWKFYLVLWLSGLLYLQVLCPQHLDYNQDWLSIICEWDQSPLFKLWKLAVKWSKLWKWKITLFY